MNYLEAAVLPESWQDFLIYKIEKQHLSASEQETLKKYIEEERYMPYINQLSLRDYQLPIPYHKEISKGGTSKKRVVYSYPEDFNWFLKWVAFSLYKYDDVFAENCYAFRRNLGAQDAFKRILGTPKIGDKWCLKVDISNYFNSIKIPFLMEKLAFIKIRDEHLYALFEHLLGTNQVYGKVSPKNPSPLKKDTPLEAVQDYKIMEEEKGVMAGTPFSPFLANVYLSEVDHFFEDRGILYFRYSDDILIFADCYEELMKYQDLLFDAIKHHMLELNFQKVHIVRPGETWEFLGLCYKNGEVDLSENSLRKMKQKIKRKAHALRRWSDKKGLDGEKAAKGFVKAINRKLYGLGGGTDFSWSRWFFPILTTDKGLKEIDQYIQRYIRYCVTGRHYKGNYRIRYQQLKAWGYRSLVHEYYRKREEMVATEKI